MAGARNGGRPQDRPQDRHDERRAMVDDIAAETREAQAWLGKSSLDARVMAVMEDVPRHCFVPPDAEDIAYRNRPLRIGHDQTISQPFIVALMSDLAEVQPGDRVLEIGTGSGYQAAVLAALGAEVYSVERITELAETAKARLQALGYDKVSVRTGDGSVGWPEAAPFAVILVTAATQRSALPALSDQLAAGGRLVVPLTRDDTPRGYIWGEPETDLCVIVKDREGKTTETAILPVAFVPMIRPRALS